MLIEMYKFADDDPMTVLRFLAQFKCACDPNGVSERWPLRLYQTL